MIRLLFWVYFVYTVIRNFFAERMVRINVAYSMSRLQCNDQSSLIHSLTHFHSDWNDVIARAPVLPDRLWYRVLGVVLVPPIHVRDR